MRGDAVPIIIAKNSHSDAEEFLKRNRLFIADVIDAVNARVENRCFE